jgi:hypothetical protein
LPSPEVKLPVRFLPKWDAALLSHADRRRILPEAIHKDVYKAINAALVEEGSRLLSFMEPDATKLRVEFDRAT